MIEYDNIRKLLITMIKDYSLYKDDIGYTKSELDKFIEEYKLIDFNCNYDEFEILYDNGYLTKKQYLKRLKEFLNDGETDQIDFIEFIEKNGLVDYFLKDIKPENIRKEGDDWYFYAYDGWGYFTDYFNVSNNYRNNVVEMILKGDGYEIFDYSYHDFDIRHSYLEVNDENLKYLKTIIQNMVDDYEIDQDDIDDISDFDDVVKIVYDYDLDDMKIALEIVCSRAQSYADENEAHNTLTNDIIEHFGFTTDGIKWVKGSDRSKYDDTLKIKFKDENSVKETILLLFKIDNVGYYDEIDDDWKIDFDEPYNGWQGDAGEHFNVELQDLLPDNIDKKYLQKN